MSRTDHLHLFEGYGIEMEFMIVNRTTLAVEPLCDFVLEQAAGELVNEVEFGDMAWSNELVKHVIELKTNGPRLELKGLHELFLQDIKRINQILAAKNACLMPTAMHPFMNPATDTHLWVSDAAEIYEAYDRIFSCKGHGWSNLQSVHINFPFYDDKEFGRLHAAIRVVLPILPALAASSPVFEGTPSGMMDSRLDFYMKNQRSVPLITGPVIPERAFSYADYENNILKPVYYAIKPHDPDGILQHEWLNSRGAIARFERHAIEIRLLDIQESPRMDMAVVAAVTSLVHALADERWTSLDRLMEWHETPLRQIFLNCVIDGSQAAVDNDDYLKLFNYPSKGPTKAQDLWRHITQDLLNADKYPINSYRSEIEMLVKHGCLARRLVKALGPKPSRDQIAAVYRSLCDLLPAGGFFNA
ncbi:MAG: glutamate--cysteine ligase [Deltaproteobacteria bacterium]|nr:glutamate--cysteine ligase [Deltaproteobacteria bacterium]